MMEKQIAQYQVSSERTLLQPYENIAFDNLYTPDPKPQFSYLCRYDYQL